jgi:alkylresorcinol/alkylpyrone synthase
MNIPYIVGVQTAVPPYCVQQNDVRDLVHALFCEQYRGIERLMPVFENTQIQTRYFSAPLSWFAEQQRFVQSNAAYTETALNISADAAHRLLQQHGVDAADVEMVIAVSTTGIATPSLDGKLIQRLKLRASTRRMPVWGLGCAGGVAGLARTAELVRSLPTGKYALMVAVELCSLTFQRNDISKSNIVASSLFADGAAAVLVRSGEISGQLSGQTSRTALPEILGSYSHLFDDSEDIMGWDIIETGLKVRFSRDIPTLIRQHLPLLLDQATASWGVRREDLKHYVVHAGGAKVLQAYQDLGIPRVQLEPAYSVLRHYGNMSSVSVLFALQEFLADTPPTGELGLMVALGPGFSAEFLLFRW